MSERQAPRERECGRVPVAIPTSPMPGNLRVPVELGKLIEREEERARLTAALREARASLRTIVGLCDPETGPQWGDDYEAEVEAAAKAGLSAIATVGSLIAEVSDE